MIQLSPARVRGRESRSATEERGCPSQAGNRPSLRRNFAWAATGNSVYSLCQWGVLILLAKLRGPLAVGQFTYALAIAAPVVMFANLQLRSVQATDARSEYEFPDYLGLRILASAAALTAIATIAVAASDSREALLVTLGVGLMKAVEAVGDIFYGFLQKHERMNLVARSLLLKGAGSVICFGCVLRASGSVVLGVLSLALLWTCLLVFYDLRNCVTLAAGEPEGIWALLRPRFDARTLRRLAAVCAPLGLATTMNSLNTNIPRYYLEHALGKHALGLFSGLSYVQTASIGVAISLGQVVGPRLSRCYWSANRTEFVRLLGKNAAAGLLLGGTGILVAAIAGGFILRVLYTPEYANYARQFACLMAAAAILHQCCFLNDAMIAMRMFRSQTALLILVSATSMLSSHWLIPRLGIAGAAYAVLVSAVAQLAGSLGLVVCRFRLHFTGYERALSR